VITLSKRKYQQRMRQHGTKYCTWCHVELTRHNITRDHILPRVLAPSTGLDNIVLACEECNSAVKGDAAPEHWGLVMLMAHVGYGLRERRVA
jgi:5-methylcytosine-specific restriction endonuclease McrA